MYGYIFAILGGVIILLLMVLLFTGGMFGRSKENRDKTSGTSYQNPQAEGAEVSKPRVDPAETPPNSKSTPTQPPK